MSLEVFWKENALRNLNRLEILVRKRIVNKVLEVAETGNFHGAKRMQGYNNVYRLRVGDYRVIFELDSEGIHILKVGHRKNIY